jgi:nucleotide-binding universal stress UspA family protein
VSKDDYDQKLVRRDSLLTRAYFASSTAPEVWPARALTRRPEPMIRRILVANDGSEGARIAVTTAVELAARCGAELHAVSVGEVLPNYAATIGEVEAAKERRDQHFDRIAAETETVAAAYGVDVQTHVTAGHEVEAILTLCREGHHFDLLVLGFIGHSPVVERIWGSSSQTLTRLAPCSVLVAK